MYTVLDTYTFLRLKPEGIQSLIWPIMTKETDPVKHGPIMNKETDLVVNKTSQHRRVQDQMVWVDKFYWTFKEKLTPTLTLTKNLREHSQTHFTRPLLTLILKLTNDNTRKGNYRHFFIPDVYSNAQFFNKILANWIQQHIKRIINHKSVI